VNGKLIFLGIIAAFVALAIFSREPTGPDVSGDEVHNEGGDEEARGAKRKKGKKGKARKGRKQAKNQRQRRDIETPENPIPTGRFDDENSGRRSTPFYRHAKIASNRWQALANELETEGRAELSESAKTLSRALRQARRPNAQETDQEALLLREQETIAQMRGAELSEEQAQEVERLAKAATRVASGEPEGKSDVNDASTPQEIP
jgi:flagellum-specific peptidoglycan hydrolase FlgJ